jgi:pentose-5-phosphate-3-epimerase
MKILVTAALTATLTLPSVSFAATEQWTVINDTDTVKIERSNATKKTDIGFTGTFRKIDKATKAITPLIISVDCGTKFYELKDIPKAGDDVSVISSGIANPDHKLFAYIEKGCK